MDLDSQTFDFDFSQANLEALNLEKILQEFPSDSPQHTPVNSSPSSEQEVNGFFNAIDELSENSTDNLQNSITNQPQTLNLQNSNSAIPESILSNTAFLPYTPLNLAELHHHQPPKNRTELETLLKKIASASPSPSQTANPTFVSQIPSQTMNAISNQSLQNLQAIATSHFLAQQTMNQQQNLINQVASNAVQPPSKHRIQNNLQTTPLYTNTQNDQTSTSLTQAFMLSQNQNPAQSTSPSSDEVSNSNSKKRKLDEGCSFSMPPKQNDCHKLQELAQKSSAHAALLSVLFNEKDIHSLCSKLMSFLSGYFQCEYGAVYVNNLDQMKWSLAFAYPDQDIFSEYFATNTNFPTVQKSILSHQPAAVSTSASIEGTHKLVSWLVMPIYSDNLEEKEPVVAVFILGSAEPKFDIANCVSYLSEIKSCLARALGMLTSDRTMLLKQIEYLKNENEQLKKMDQFNKSIMVSILGSMDDTSIICTTTKGLITYFSPGAARMLGYSPGEMIGKKTPLSIHDPKEVAQRSIELQRDFGRRIQGFEVFVEYPKMGLTETRTWHYKLKDGTLKKVCLTVKPLWNSQSTKIMGFIGIARVIEKDIASTLEPS